MTNRKSLFAITRGIGMIWNATRSRFVPAAVVAALIAGLGLHIAAERPAARRGSDGGTLTAAGGRDPTGAEDRPEVFRRYIVQLRGAPLARYDGNLPGIRRPPRDPRGKLLINSAEALAYLAVLDRRRAAFESDLVRALPLTKVHYRYRILYNGVAVKAPTWSVPVLASLSNVTAVRSTDRVMYKPFMDVSLPIIGAQTFWNATGGVNFAGEQIKVAVIDTGIDHTNPFFHDFYFQMPMGYPKGATAFTTKKVIAARAYFRPDDPVNTERDEPNPMDHQGHGSHCAGTIAGVKDTVFDLGGFQATVSGVAPRAYLMNYKVFYRATSGTAGATEPELMAAFEDAVADGADVISNSWGGPDVFGPHDPSMEAYEAAVEAGCIVVFAAGNEGPGNGSVGSPGSYRRFITVGATTTGRYFTRYMDVTGPAPVPSNLEEIPMSVGRISASFSQDVGPAPLLSSHLADGGTNELGCQAFTPGVFDGAIAMVLRGDCTFEDKAQHVADASAIGVIVQNNDPAQAPFSMSGDRGSIPAVMISYADGQNLRNWVDTHNDAEAVIRVGQIPIEEPADYDNMASFSSVGPTAWANLKPDVAAPGTLILSADAHSVSSSSTRPWGLMGGTSMATPHVAGVAALLKQHHPEWTHDDIKAAMVGTAVRAGIQSSLGGQANTYELGGGRVDLAALLDIRVLVDPPFLEAGETVPPATLTATLRVRGVSPDVSEVALQWNFDGVPDGIYVDPPSDTTFTLGPDGVALIPVTFIIDEEVEPADVSNYLFLRDNGGGSTVVPYYLRILPAGPEVDLLLVDLTFFQENSTSNYLPIYAATAAEAGLTFESAPVASVVACPPMPELLRYRAVLLTTGDDRWYHYSWTGSFTLNRISDYLAKGGSVIVAGQGPLRDTIHTRFAAMTGTAALGSLPLYDENTGGLLTLSEYRVIPLDEPLLITADLTLGIGPSMGNLAMLGELIPAISEGYVPWSHPVLRMTEGNFVAYGDVAMVYDPFHLYGQDRLAEAHDHRAVYLGFGLEVIEEPEPTGQTPEPGSRAELLLNAFTWVTERVHLDLHVVRVDREATFHAQATSVHSEITGYTFDFGDGSDPVETTDATVDHVYDRFGLFDIAVFARSSLGAAAVVRRTLMVQPGSEGIDAGSDAFVDGDASDASPSRELPTYSGCMCNTATGKVPAPNALLLVLVLLLVPVLRRKRSGIT